MKDALVKTKVTEEELEFVCTVHMMCTPIIEVPRSREGSVPNGLIHLTQRQQEELPRRLYCIKEAEVILDLFLAWGQL